MHWWETILRLALAVVIGCVIGIEREHKHRPAGMRTHMLVCEGAAIVAVLETLMLPDTAAMGAVNVAVSRGRMAAQVISGIGFLGAGTIFVSKKKITGLTTAASLWNTACLGLAVGMGYYELAVLGCAAVMITLVLMRRVVMPSVLRHMEIEYTGSSDVMEAISGVFARRNVRVIDMDVRMVRAEDDKRMSTNCYTLDVPGKMDYAVLIGELMALPGVTSVHLAQNEA